MQLWTRRLTAHPGTARTRRTYEETLTTGNRSHVGCGTSKAQAATVGPGGTAEGLTYDISVSGGSLNSTTATFLLHITGINRCH